MKLLLTSIAAATIAATSAFAVTTSEDRAFDAAQRANGITSIGQEVMIEPVFKLSGRSAISEGNTVTVTLVDTKSYDETDNVGRR